MPSLTLDWVHIIILLGAIQGVFLTVALALPVYLMSGPDKIAWYHRLLAGDVPLWIRLINRANSIRRRWIDYWAIATGSRASMTADPH
jgi:hypothetical protein